MDVIKYVNISLEIWGAIFSMAIALCMILSKSAKGKLNRLYFYILVCNTVILLSDAAAWGFKGNTDLLSRGIVYVSNFFVFFFGYLLLAVFTNYLVSYIGLNVRKTKNPIYIVNGICIIAIILVVVSQWNHMYYWIDENNQYQRGTWFWLSQVWGILCMMINGRIIIRKRNDIPKRELVVLSSYIVLPAVAMVIQIFIYGVALLNIATTISIFLVYIGIQIEQARILKEKELELAESRIDIMLSQIQPHFLYNTLTAISRLCDIDGGQAKKAIVAFATYLRGNLDSLTQKTPVPFEKELKHIRIYLSLEKMRFEDKLNIVYEIQTSSFLIPALTVQPLVENAVRYGIGKKENGGTITISTVETVSAFVVRIHDDGIGFDVSRLHEDDRTHIGIHNVRNRLMAQCGGLLVINSTMDVGTTAIITLPKEREKDDDRCN